MIKDDCDVEAQFQGWEFLPLPMPRPNHCPGLALITPVRVSAPTPQPTSISVERVVPSHM